MKTFTVTFPAGTYDIDFACETEDAVALVRGLTMPGGAVLREGEELA